MDISNLSQYTTLSVEASCAFLLFIVGWKLYKMKVHTRSGCCDDHVLIETMSRADSKNDLEFSTLQEKRLPGSVI
jgi:hypothetical protein